MNKVQPRYKLNRRPYKGETWKILERVGDGWRVHSQYSHSCLRDEAFKKLTKGDAV